jgi:hypothetical protein
VASHVFEACVARVWHAADSRELAKEKKEGGGARRRSCAMRRLQAHRPALGPKKKRKLKNTRAGKGSKTRGRAKMPCWRKAATTGLDACGKPPGPTAHHTAARHHRPPHRSRHSSQPSRARVQADTDSILCRAGLFAAGATQRAEAGADAGMQHAHGLASTEARSRPAASGARRQAPHARARQAGCRCCKASRLAASALAGASTHL